MKSKEIELSIGVSNEETSYRQELFKDLSEVFQTRMFCTCCKKDIKNIILRKEKAYIHPFFKVLLCKGCLKFYGNGYMSADEDGSDKYCRWCGQGGCLYVCSECPISICKSCIRRNLNRSVQKSVEDDDWKCFRCNPKPLFELRGQAWAVKEYFKAKKAPKHVDAKPEHKNDSPEGRLLSGLDYEISSIKEMQKLLRSYDMKLGGLTRRKELINREHINWEIINRTSQELISHMCDLVSKTEELKNNVDSFFKAMASVIDNSEINQSGHSSDVKSKVQDNNKSESKKRRSHSSDESSSAQNKKKRNSSPKDYLVNNCQSPTSVVSDVISDVENNSSSNEVDMASVPNEDNHTNANDSIKKSLYTVENNCDELPNDNDEKFPKLCLRIRKIDEVNRVLMETENKNLKADSKTGSTENCEVIELDDDSADTSAAKDSTISGDAKQPSNSNDVSEITDVDIPEATGVDVPEVTSVDVPEVTGADEPEHTDTDVPIINSVTEDNSELAEVVKESDTVNGSREDCLENNVTVKDKGEILEENVSPSDSDSKKNHSKNKKGSKKDNKVKSDSGKLDLPSDSHTKNKTISNIEESSTNASLCNTSDNDVFENSPTNVITLSSSDSSSDSSSNSVEEIPSNKRKVRKSQGQRNSSSRIRRNTSDQKDSDSDIEKLIDMKSLDRKERTERQYDKERRKTKNTEEEESTKKKESVVRNKKKTILDYCGEDSDASVMDLKGEINSILSTIKPVKKKEILDSIRQVFMELSDSSADLFSSGKEATSDDKDDLLKDSDDERNSKKKSKKKTKVVPVEDDSNDSKSSEVGKGSKPKWQNDKLLTLKLSDDSDSDAFKTKKTNNKKPEDRGKKKIIILSDSEEEINSKKKTKNSSESSDSDSSDSIEEVTPSKKRRRIKNASNSSDEDNVEESGGKGHRKNIKKVLKKDNLEQSTQNAVKEEEERKKRIAERQKLYNQMMEECEKLSGKVDSLVLDFDPETKKELLSVDKDLVIKLKPHQAEGIKFMWDSCFETVKKAKETKGSGCILAHCMGLGKTLQVVALLHTLLNNDVGVKSALVLCPLSTVLNWVSEFEKWLSNVGSGQDVDVYHLTKVNAEYRAHQLREWNKRGGVMILGYNLFRLLINPVKRVKASFKKVYLETLSDPGPDIVVADEGHLLKNEKTALSKSVEKIKTMRRIVLTGTPLQNNLNEYHCMMQFVKPQLLGTKKEFINRFVNPIENGQFVDSTPHDVKVMKRRAHVLHKMLDGVVQRKAYTVLIPFLPTKFEYVLNLSLTDVQVKLYQHYLDNFSRTSSIGAGTSLFKDRNMLGLICAHPRLLIVQKENELMKKDFEESDEEGSLKDFIHDDSSSESTSSSKSSSDSDSSGASVKSVEKPRKRLTRSNKDEEPEIEQEEENDDVNWWSSMTSKEDMEDIGASSKLLLLFTILKQCEEIGDKILVFSQSLLALDLIEYFLAQIDEYSHSENPPPGLRGFQGTWVKSIDYFRLDGKTNSENRSNWCSRFNREDNFRARLFLISTRAGGLGINLTGANRVILFDASWNPSHDVQSIFRIYRFGQSKPCYIYRFLNKGTMEQKVYDRQVTKLSMSCRVIDEQQIDRHFSFSDLNELYTFTPNEKNNETPPLPKDRLLAEMLKDHSDLVLWYHTHDSLLENQLDEELNEEERKQAWADFENEKKPPPDIMGSFSEMYQKIQLTLREKYPHWSDADLNQATVTVLSKMNTNTNTKMVPPYQQQQAQQQFTMQNRLHPQFPMGGYPTGQTQMQRPVLLRNPHNPFWNQNMNFPRMNNLHFMERANSSALPRPNQFSNSSNTSQTNVLPAVVTYHSMPKPTNISTPSTSKGNN